MHLRSTERYPALTPWLAIFLLYLGIETKIASNGCILLSNCTNSSQVKTLHSNLNSRTGFVWFVVWRKDYSQKIIYTDFYLWKRRNKEINPLADKTKSWNLHIVACSSKYFVRFQQEIRFLSYVMCFCWCIEEIEEKKGLYCICKEEDGGTLKSTW